MQHEGGCLCSETRYAAIAEPVRVTFCHCRFCQRATGSAYLVEPVFRRDDFAIINGNPKTYEHRSEGSGKIVAVKFCDNCGTKLFLEFERFTDVIGVYGGTFDNPDWFEKNPVNSKHIFLSEAQFGTIIPPGFSTFTEHSILADGTPAQPRVPAKPLTILK